MCMHHASLRFLYKGRSWMHGHFEQLTPLLLSPDCFRGELLQRWKWRLWAKPPGFNLWLFCSASGGSLSGEPRVLTWTHMLSQRSWMVALSWCSWSHGWEWVQAVVYGSLRLPERSLDCCVVMVEIWIKISSSCSPRKPLDLALVCLSCKCVRCNTEHARPASQEASHTA